MVLVGFSHVVGYRHGLGGNGIGLLSFSGLDVH